FIASNNSEVYEANASVENDIVVDVPKGGVTVNLYYTETGNSSVAFIDQSDRLVVSKTYANGASLSEEVITEAKNKYEANLPSGYEYGNITDETGNPVSAGLKIDTDKLFTVNSKKKADYASFDVLVQRDSGVESSRVAFDEIATVTSTAENFSYWMIGEKIVSYEKEYSFSVYSDTVIKEVCGETVEKKPVVTLHRDNIADKGMANIYEVKYEIPAGFELVETGMIFGGTTLKTATSKVVARRITSNNEYSVKSAADGVHRSYLIYRKDGKLNVIYDDGYGVEQLVFNNTLQSDGGVASSANVDSQIVTSEAGLTLSGYTNINLGKESTLKMTGTSAESSFIISSATKQIDKVVISAKNYNVTRDECTITVGDVSKDLTTDFVSQAFSISATQTVNIANNKKTGSDKKGRALVKYLEVYYADREKSEEINLSGLTLGDLSKVISDITLPTEYEGNAVTWTSSDPSVISETGVVTLPDTDVAKVTLTATVKGKSKSFDAVVYSYDAYLGEVLTQITVPETVEDGVTNINLPATVDGVKIFWGTSDSSTITYKGVVTHFELDKKVTLTATAYIGDTYGSAIAKKSKEFTVVVAAKKVISGVTTIDAKDASTALPTSDAKKTPDSSFTSGGVELKAPYCTYFSNYKAVILQNGNAYIENKEALAKPIASITVNLSTSASTGAVLAIEVGNSTQMPDGKKEGDEVYSESCALDGVLKKSIKFDVSTVPGDFDFFRIYQISGTKKVHFTSIVIEYKQ
ncbi:MAG: immunoglobulin-like domain-containing protein, partial [Bacilli bacterium]|nr:immunoglobulin-like domain-containing protein [Bacilli bacterium]